MSTPAIPHFPIGIGPPNVWPITFLQGDSGLDMTTVSAVLLDVTREVDGSTDTWTAAVQPGSSAEEMVANVAFTGAEISTPGLYLVAPRLVVPGGEVPAEALRIFAVAPNRLRL